MAMTAAQICSMAASIAKGPGMLTLAGQMLNLVLEDLVLNRDLKINRTSTTISLSASTYGPTNLGATYLRTYDLYYYRSGSTGEPYHPIQISMEAFNSRFKDGGASFPEEFATDISPQATGSPATLYVYPQASAALTLYHWYMVQRAWITTPESSSSAPWFPNSDYLVKATAARMMGITGDDRQAQFEASALDMLGPYLIMQGDEQKVVKEVKLDPQHFRMQRRMPPTKTQPW